MKFNQFEKILSKTIKEFKQIEKMGIIGITGSKNLKKELDFLVAPKEGVKQGKFLKILCNFLEEFNKNIEKENSRLIIFTYSIFEDEVKFLSERKEDDIFLHILNLHDISLNNKEIMTSIFNSTKMYYGKKEFKSKRTNIDYYYRYLFFINCLYSNYPKRLETEKIHSRIFYILKHLKGNIDFKNKTNKEIYFECCDFLDSKAKKI